MDRYTSRRKFDEKQDFYISLIVTVLVTQSYLTLCEPMDCSPPGSSVHEILQARILEWVAIPFSRGYSQLWLPNARSQLIGKDLDPGKD